MIKQQLPCSGEFHANYDGSFTPINFVYTSDHGACLVVQGNPHNIDFGNSLVSADTAVAHDDTDPDNIFMDVLPNDLEFTVDLSGPSTPL